MEILWHDNWILCQEYESKYPKIAAEMKKGECASQSLTVGVE
jgi:hypothetical protein